MVKVEEVKGRRWRGRRWKRKWIRGEGKEEVR